MSNEEQATELRGAALKTMGPVGAVIVGLLVWVQTGVSDLRTQLVPRDVFDAKMESVVDSQRELKVEMQLLGQRVMGIETDLSYFRGRDESRDQSER